MFLPGGADPDEVAFYLLAWAERRLGATVDEDRTRIRVKVRGGKIAGLLVELAAVLASGRRLEVFVETDEEGNAVQFAFGLLPAGRGRPLRMWHFHPGHRDDPTPYHIHEPEGSRRSLESMSFSEITWRSSPPTRPEALGGCRACPVLTRWRHHLRDRHFHAEPAIDRQQLACDVGRSAEPRKTGPWRARPAPLPTPGRHPRPAAGPARGAPLTSESSLTLVTRRVIVLA